MVNANGLVREHQEQVPKVVNANGLVPLVILLADAEGLLVPLAQAELPRLPLVRLEALLDSTWVQ